MVEEAPMADSQDATPVPLSTGSDGLSSKQAGQKRVHVWVSGRVQGVGFRAHVDYRARQIGVHGWVRNTGWDGVEAVAEGDETNLRLFVEMMKQGPPGARVLESKVEWENPSAEFASFTVKRSA